MTNQEHIGNLFIQRIPYLDQRFALLIKSPFVSEEEIRQTAKGTRGVYVFYEHGEALYVGRTDDFKRRMGLHRNPGSRRNQAGFAYKLARKQLKIEKVPYKATHPSHPLNHPAFDQAFSEAKLRVRQMQVRFIPEKDPINQALLEIYVHLTLDTPYNDFNNH